MRSIDDVLFVGASGCFLIIRASFLIQHHALLFSFEFVFGENSQLFFDRRFVCDFWPYSHVFLALTTLALELHFSLVSLAVDLVGGEVVGHAEKEGMRKGILMVEKESLRFSHVIPLLHWT
jgi:hypothetical protein